MDFGRVKRAEDFDRKLQGKGHSMRSACIVGKSIVRLFVGAFVANLRPRTIAALVALSLCLPMPRLAAQEITPAHVYQVVANLIAELALLHEADFAVYQADPEPTMPTQRRPRHVIQKARSVMEKIQMLRFINGLEVARLDPLPVREVEPGDVKALADDMLSALRELKPVYGVTATPEPAARVPGITPTEVYAKLVRADAMIDALGLPAVVPNDVCRVALAIVRDLELICCDGKAGTAVAQPAPAGLTSDDVLGRAFEVLRALKRLVEDHPAYAIPGGIVLPPRKQRDIVPADVLELLNHALAELSSIKVARGIATPTRFAAPLAGRTPNQAFALLSVALGLIGVLEQRAAGS